MEVAPSRAVVGLFGGGRRGGGGATGTVVPLPPPARPSDADPPPASDAAAPEVAPPAGSDGAPADPPAEKLLADRDRLLADLASHLAERSRAAATLAVERDRLAAALADASGAGGRHADPERLAGIEAALHEAREERARAVEAHAADRRLVEQLRAEMASTRQELERLRVENAAAAATIERVAGRLRELEEERAALVARADALETERTRLVEQARRLDAEAAGGRVAATEPDAPAAAGAGTSAADAPPPADVSPAAGVSPEADVGPAPDASPAPDVSSSTVATTAAEAGAGGAAEPPADPAPHAPAEPPALVVIDALDASTLPAGAVLFDPQAPPPAPPPAIAVNLAAPNALAALAGLAASGRTPPATGYAALPGAHDALPLGAVVALVPPVDAGRIVAGLGERAVRGARVLTVGDEHVPGLRPALAQRGLSVSMAFDVKQADELLDVVRPQIVVVALRAVRVDACAFLVRAAALSPAGCTVFVGGAVAADGFHAALADPAVAPRLVRRARLLADAAAPR